jgi:hypothetical protein
MQDLKGDSQNAMVLAHLARGKTLTQLDALRKFGSMRLGARIYELKRRGHRIKAQMVTLSNGKIVAEYSMPSARARA